MSKYKNKKVTVVGLARSGLASANLLDSLGAEVWVTDAASTPQIHENLKKLKSHRIKVQTGKHTREFIEGRDLVVISPGVSDKSEAVLWAGELNVPVISELELAASLCKGKIIAITGTNGKTTVTTLVGEILKFAGKKVFVLGNIGTPFSAEVMNIGKDDFVSLEVSSFQLEKIKTFRPYVAVVLNFTQDHLDRYKDINEYLQAKKRIFLNQTKDDWAVLNFDDPVVRALDKSTKAVVRYFNQGSSTSNLNPNQLAVMTVGSIFGISKESCYEVFKNFKGIEHRMEFVTSINGIEFINDSKGTTVDSTVWALKNMSRPVVLIAGGLDKKSDYSVIKDLVKERVKKVVLIGQAKEKIRRSFEGLLPLEDAGSFDEAVSVAFKSAKDGDIVLLSPMCASFDMFKDYEERGRIFKDIVRKIEAENGAPRA